MSTLNTLSNISSDGTPIPCSSVHFQLPTDKYYIILTCDNYQQYKIIHNSYLSQLPTRERYYLQRVEDKSNNSYYRTLGTFATPLEAKIWVRLKRIERLIKEVETSKKQIAKITAPLGTSHPELLLKMEEGMLKKLLEWRDKYVNLHPEYFV